MGNKVSPNTLRLGIYRRHDSDWIASDAMLPKLIYEDHVIRTYIKQKFEESAGVVKIFISRNKNGVELSLRCLQPSVVIGKKGGEINSIVEELQKKLGYEVKIKIFDIKKPEINAHAIGLKISEELKKKGASCRRIIKKYIQLAMKNGALGVRIECKGRLGGIEIARTDWVQEGSVPRQKLRANIDYALVHSMAKWGTSGVKVWVNNGDIIVKKSEKLGDKDAKS